MKASDLHEMHNLNGFTISGASCPNLSSCLSGPFPLGADEACGRRAEPPGYGELGSTGGGGDAKKKPLSLIRIKFKINVCLN
jgi:hypothetical protein